jgi:hypothetical protein
MSTSFAPKDLHELALPVTHASIFLLGIRHEASKLRFNKTA